ncbi:MAG: leucine-rich repeat protein [Bacilli bacterium]|nr:leucine-rich repeat protein [Bacilli bacterium]
MELKKSKKLLFTILSSALVISGMGFLSSCDNRENIYIQASQHLANYELEEAKTLFTKILGYRDSLARKGVAIGLEMFFAQEHYLKCAKKVLKYGGEINVSFNSKGSPNDDVLLKEAVIDQTSELEHYDFSGWKVETFSYLKNTHRINLSLFANFNPHVYSIDYELNEGFVVDPPRSYTYGTKVIIPDAYCDGYTFVGWNDGKSNGYYKPYIITKDMGEDVNLTARFSPNTYHIEFDPNGGECDIQEADYTFGETYTLPTPTKFGYTFTGWYTEKTHKKVENVFNISENCKVIAEYEYIEYPISYELYDGMFFDEYPTGYNIETDGLRIPYPYRNGYLFAGWVEEENDGDQTILDYVINRGSSGPVKLHAIWAKCEVDNGGQRIASNSLPTIPSGLPHTDYYYSIVIPYHITDIAPEAFNNTLFVYSGIKKFALDKRNRYLNIIDGKYICTLDGKELIKMAAPYSDESLDIVLPKSIETLRSKSIPVNGGANKITGENVTTICDHAAMRTNINEIDFPNCKYIGDYAFSYSESLTNINRTFDHVKHIGCNSFELTKLTSVTINEDVEYVGYEAFAANSFSKRMTSFTCLSDKVESLDAVLYGQSLIEELTLKNAVTPIADLFKNALSSMSLRKVTVLSGETICDDFLKGIQSVTIVEILGDVKYIGKRSFSGINAEKIPDLSHVVSIGEEAFMNCEELTSINLSPVLTHIGPHAFKDTSIEEIVIPDSVTDIGFGIFEECEGLQKITINKDSFTSFRYLFGDSAIPRNLEVVVTGTGQMKENQFENAFGVQKVVLSEGLQLNKKTFYDCRSLEEIVLPSSVQVIPEHCFDSCLILEHIDLPNVTEISDYAFNNCQSLVAIETYHGLNVLPSTLETLGSYAFAGLVNLPSLTLNKELTYVGNGVLANDTFVCNIPNAADMTNWSRSYLSGFFGTVNSV